MTCSIATLASVVFHTVGLIGLALVTWGAVEPHANVDEGFEVAIATLASDRLDRHAPEHLEADVTTSRGEEDRLDSIDLEIDGPRNPAGEAAIDALIGVQAPSGSAGESLQDVDVATAPVGAVDGAATFMGVQAQGRRFCIIADRSGSMFGTKFEFLRQEILATLDGMRSHTRVQIILFNTRALAFPDAQWLSPREKRDAIEVWLSGVVADGDTYPTPAFKSAFALQPLPDAIFFMTDGQFDPRVVQQVLRLNTEAQRKVPIHTITFVDRSAEPMMRKIAADSGGKYRHVSGAFKAPVAK